MNKPAKKQKLHVRRGDTVRALSGADAGKQGKVLKVFPKTGRVLVEGLNFVTKHLRKSNDNPQGGVVTKEAPMAACKLAVVTPAEKKTDKE
ncbi:MAG: 50S ribosomal protein L24 [Kiritimatiellae bacterium]|jgi:large subunit ribosomal protein L24|nr:50S ribosomal protein L24 [Kiritimatiellia bacterium]